MCYNSGSALGNVIEQSGTLWNKLLKENLSVVYDLMKESDMQKILCFYLNIY